MTQFDSNSALEPCTEAQNQAKVAGLVEREVGECISQLITHVVQNTDEVSEYYDDLISICVKDDFEEPVRWAVGNYFDRDMRAEYCKCHAIPYAAGGLGEYLEALILDFLTKADGWQKFADEHNIDPHQVEALEHWTVSDWLVEKLAAKGEMVCDDIIGLTVWGRTTSGQAIYMDDVINEIYAELHQNDQS